MRRAWLAPLVLAALWVACGDDDSVESTSVAAASSSVGSGGSATSSTTAASTGGATSSSTGGMGSGPGTITLVVSGRDGSNGDRVVASILEDGNDTALARMCETIAGGAASSEALAIDPGAIDPCEMLGAPVVFDEGSYQVRAGIYPSGSPTPSLCVSMMVTVAGDVSATLPAFVDCL
jgi:hypothetical protein